MTDEAIRQELKIRFPDRPVRLIDGAIYIADRRVDAIDRQAVGRSPKAEIDRLAEETKKALA